jgi:hypothetical protein
LALVIVVVHIGTVLDQQIQNLEKSENVENWTFVFKKTNVWKILENQNAWKFKMFKDFSFFTLWFPLSSASSTAVLPFLSQVLPTTPL